MKTLERAEARRLRADEGLSVKEITARLGVARSSVSLWVRDIELSPEQHERLRRRNPIYNGQRIGAKVRSARARVRRQEWQEEGRSLARRCEPFHVAGCMLYWAEGDRARNRVSFSNSDPEMVRLFVSFLRRYFAIQDDQIALACNLYADHFERQTEIEEFWLATAEVPPKSLRKSTVNQYSKHSLRKRLNVLPYGTCRITVHSTAVAQSIHGSIQEYAGFERPECSTCARSALHRGEPAG